MALQRHYPEKGQDGFVAIANVPYPENLKSIETLVQNLESSDSIFSVESWYTDFKEYVNVNFNTGSLPTNYFTSLFGH